MGEGHSRASRDDQFVQNLLNIGRLKITLLFFHFCRTLKIDHRKIKEGICLLKAVIDATVCNKLFSS
jgi:hypothetical protein